MYLKIGKQANCDEKYLHSGGTFFFYVNPGRKVSHIGKMSHLSEMSHLI